MNEHEETVRAAAAAYRRAESAATHARDTLAAAAVAALKAGERPTDVTVWSTLTAAYIRRFARAADIPPAPSGRRAKPRR